MKGLALVDAPDHVCCRYRIRAFEPSLVESGSSISIEGLAPGLASRTAQLLRASAFDFVILQRKLLSSWQLTLLRRSARRLIFDFDDAVLFRDSYDPRGPHCPRRAVRFAHTVRSADVILAGNDFLAECARKHGAQSNAIQVIPTCVAAELYPTWAGSEKQGLDLVWIGSSSTLRGLEHVTSLWQCIGRVRPQVRLRLISDRFADFSPLVVVPILWSEATERQELAAGDLGVTWLPDDLWSRGKCGLKLLQYQAAGLPVIANPVGVHPQMIEPGSNGFLAATSAEWLDAIDLLAGDFAARQRMGRAGRSLVESRYSVRAWSAAFVSSVLGKAPPRALRGLHTVSTRPETAEAAGRQGRT
jgi:glycosyltransferase involved in cell wall biosynthesis